jgi:hypothetical protein
MGFVQYMENVANQGNSSEVLCPGFLLGADHVDTRCLAHTQISRLPEGKQVFGTRYVVHTNSLGIVSYFYLLGSDGDTFEMQDPRHHRVNLEGGLPEDSSDLCVNSSA